MRGQPAPKLIALIRDPQARIRFEGSARSLRGVRWRVFEAMDGPGDNVGLAGTPPVVAIGELRWEAGTRPATVGAFADRDIHVYRVLEHVVLDQVGTLPPDGWRRFGTHVRKASVSREEFLQAWTIGHARLVRRHHPGVVRYAQSVVLESGPGAPALDGIYEADFPDVESFVQRLYDSPEGARVIEADNARFVDGTLTERYFCR